jgi:CheY-like chemotaxis protein
MDGVTLARQIRQLRSKETLPLFLFSSLGRREVELEEIEVEGWLSKPLKPSQLFDALTQVFGEQAKAKPDISDQLSRTRLDPQMAAKYPLRILLAEDNAVNQKLALRLLSQMGYRADVAGNGLEAIQALERQDYDVVLMDVQMPEMDGLEASRQINMRWGKQVKPDGRRPNIIAMTANAMQGDRELCLAAGMDDYVSKPIRNDELVEALLRSHSSTTESK